MRDISPVMGDIYTFKHDNASPHKENNTSELLDANNINIMAWTAK